MIIFPRVYIVTQKTFWKGLLFAHQHNTDHLFYSVGDIFPVNHTKQKSGRITRLIWSWKMTLEQKNSRNLQLQFHAIQLPLLQYYKYTTILPTTITKGKRGLSSSMDHCEQKDTLNKS